MMWSSCSEPSRLLSNEFRAEAKVMGDTGRSRKDRWSLSVTLLLYTFVRMYCFTSEIFEVESNWAVSHWSDATGIFGIRGDERRIML